MLILMLFAPQKSIIFAISTSNNSIIKEGSRLGQVRFG